MFLNAFLQLSKKAKIDDSQALNRLYKKLSNKFKDRLIIIMKAQNLNDLILLLHDMDTNMKKISKQSQLRVKPNVSNFLNIKLLFKSYNSASTKPSTAIKVAVVSLIPITSTVTQSSTMDVSNVIKQGLIL